MKRILSLILIAVMLCSFFVGCDEVVQGTELIKVTNGYYVLENKNFSVIINKATGYIETVENVVTGMVNKNPDSGNWPFYLEYSPDGSMIYESSIAKKTNNTVSSARTYSQDGREYLELTYDDLKSDGSLPVSTGIKATVTFSLNSKDNYFKFNVSLDLTKASGQVRSLHLLEGGDLRSGDGADEYLIAPVWGRGTKWKNPIYNDYFLAGKTLAYPGSGSETLECGWLDLSGSNQGIGIGYIDKQQIVTEFRIESSGEGMSFDIVLFEPKQILGESVPLEAGSVFTTDDVLVAIHEGTWHATADAYSMEFNAAFTDENGNPDYLTADTISQKADSYYYFFREIGAINQQQYSTVAEMWANVQACAESLGARLDKSMCWFVGMNQGTYGSDTPLLAPYNENLADEGLTFQQTFEKYFGTGTNAYRGMGGHVMQYAHPFAMDLKREELSSLFPQINPYQHKEDWDGGEHWSVCIDNDIVAKLWAETVIPNAIAIQADAVQFDQGSLVQTICDMEGHNHGLDAVSRLSSHIKAINKLAQSVREQIGNEAWILSEATNDLTCRYIDILQNHWATFAPLWGGDLEPGTTMYTHPQYVYLGSNFKQDVMGNLEEYYLQSAVMGCPTLLSDGGVTDAKLEMVRFVEELRTNGDTIGYPHGYRDTLGLTNPSYGLFARVYVQGNNVTVVYCAAFATDETTLTVDLEALGFEGKGTYTFTIPAMDGATGDYQTYTVG